MLPASRRLSLRMQLRGVAGHVRHLRRGLSGESRRSSVAFTRICGSSTCFSVKGYASSSGPSVAVIGAGVSGLQTIRALRAKGFQVTAFEQNAKVGGVWRENYINFGVQVPKEFYEFPDFPSKHPRGHFPTGPETQQYIEDYVQHFELADHIRLSTSVKAVEQLGDGWQLSVDQGGEAKQERFDYCVVSTGLYSITKTFMPELAGKESFSGQVLHSTAFQDPKAAEGKRVVVVGNGKSAIDCAVEASKIPGAKVTIVGRQPHWPTPLKIADLIPFQFVFLSRLGQALVSGHRGALPGAPAHMRWWHTISRPIMAAAFTLVEVLFAAQYRNMSGPTSPLFKRDVVSDFYGFAQVLNYSFRDLVRNGTITWKMGSPEAFEQDGLKVSGETVLADTVIFATGFQKDYSYFSDELQAKLQIQNDGLYLWRHTLPAHVPRLAFVGSELATISNISSYGLQAAWLSKAWSGELDLPSAAEMQKDIEETKTWKRSWMPETASRASLVLLHQVHFHDILLKDMGMKHMRKSPNLLAEFLMPYESADYNGVVAAA